MSETTAIRRRRLHERGDHHRCTLTAPCRTDTPDAAAGGVVREMVQIGPPERVPRLVCRLHIDREVSWRGTGCTECAAEHHNRRRHHRKRTTQSDELPSWLFDTTERNHYR